MKHYSVLRICIISRPFDPALFCRRIWLPRIERVLLLDKQIRKSSRSFLLLNLRRWLWSTHQNHAIVSLWPAASCWCWYCIFIGRDLSGRNRVVPYLAIEEDTPVSLAWRWMYTDGSGEKEGANGWTADSDIHLCPPPVTMWSIFFVIEMLETVFSYVVHFTKSVSIIYAGSRCNVWRPKKKISYEFQVTCKPRCLVLFED